MPLADHKTERTFYSFGLGKVLNEQRAECVEKLSSLRVRDSSWITVVLSSIDSRLLQWLTRKQILLYILRFAPLGLTNEYNFETSLREVPPLPSPHTQKRVYETSIWVYVKDEIVRREGGRLWQNEHTFTLSSAHMLSCSFPLSFTWRIRTRGLMVIPWTRFKQNTSFRNAWTLNYSDFSYAVCVTFFSNCTPSF